jgi:ribosomal protein L11 methyltransferase
VVGVPAAEAEIARARLIELAPEGFEEASRGNRLELVVYGGREMEDVLRGLFEDVSSTRVEDGWEDGWRAFHRPVSVAGLWIGPPWEAVPEGVAAVVVDPGRAFGTGAHPTTRLALELLARLERGSLLDAGCGSGVVAVAAARLGFAPVVAVDVDPVAVEVTRRTASANGVDVDARACDVLRDALLPADVVVANIELAAVRSLLPRVHARAVVTSGYPSGREPEAVGWRVAWEETLEGWGAHVLVPPDGH